MQAKQSDRFLIFEQLKELKGIRYTRQHLSKLEKAGLFPKRVPISPSGSRVAWSEAEIDAWCEARKAARQAA